MIKTSYQVPEIRNANDEVVQEGAFGKNTALSNAENTGWIDYVMNDLEALHDTIGDSAATLDGNGHVVEPANLAIGDEDGNRLKTSYLKLTGGTVSGTVNVSQNLKMQDNQENVFGGLFVPSSSSSSQYFALYGGESPSSNAYASALFLYPVGDGRFILRSKSTDNSTSYELVGGSDGTLKWRGNTLAPLASPAMTGNPTAPTQATNNNSTRLATTAYVVNDLKSNTANLADALVDTIPSNADLDNYTTAGTYRCTASTVAATLSNAPVSGSGFKLLVMQVGYGSSSYCMQLAFATAGAVYVRSRNGTTSWTAWTRLTHKDEVLLLTGGTMNGNLVLLMNAPNSRNPLQIQYAGTTRGVSPTSSQQGYQLLFADKDGNAMGGIRRCLYTNGTSETQFNTVWSAGEGAEATDIHFTLGMKMDSNRYYLDAVPDNKITLGEASYRWKQLFAGTTTISTSDERLKGNITDIPDDVLDAWDEVGWYQYQFKDAIAEKGENARLHTGAIAQRIESVFASHGLDAFRYGLLCYDEWDADSAVRDEQGNITTPAKPAGNQYSLRYEEALCMEAAYQRRRADRLEERIARLEALVSGE